MLEPQSQGQKSAPASQAGGLQTLDATGAAGSSSLSGARFSGVSSRRSANAPSIEELRDLEVFKTLSSDALCFLQQHGEKIQIPEGAKVDTPGKHLLIITSGEVDCFLFDAVDTQFLLPKQGAGDFLGELSFLVPNRSADEKIEVRAHSAVTAIKFPNEVFFNTVNTTAEGARFIQSKIAERLAGMNHFTKQAVDINLDPTTIKATNLSERLADVLSSHIGSWRFVIGTAIFITGWVTVQLASHSASFDPYPFIFLNLVFSVVSAFTAPALLISQGRQAQIDRIAARANHRVTLRLLEALESIKNRLDRLEQKTGVDGEPDSQSRSAS